MKIAAIYCRVSTDNQETEGTSLQTQLEACLKYCQDKGYDVAYRFSEAFSGLMLERLKLNELRELVRAGDIDVIVVYCLDRLSRDPVHGVILQEELEKHHVTLEAVTESVESTEIGKLISYIRGFASKLEASKIRERTMRGKRAKALSGQIPHGGFARLYGYKYNSITKKRNVNETEATWVKQMFEWLVNEGLSTDAITYRLRSLQAPTKFGRPWCRSSVLGILKNPAYTGKTYAFTFHQGTNRRKPQNEWIEIPGATPAIISEEMFRAAQEQLKLNQERANRNTKRRYLLRSHLGCRQCGRAYCGHTDRTRSYYRCPGKQRITSPVNRCTNRDWRADNLEALVWKEIEAALEKPEVIIGAIERQRQDANQLGVFEAKLKEVEQLLKGIEREQHQLLRWALKDFPESQVETENRRLNKARETLSSQKTELEAQIKASHEATISLPKLEHFVNIMRNKLATLDFDGKRQVLDMLDIKVWLDSETVEITGVLPIADDAIVTASS